jgi:hypothetical protein
VVATGEQQVDGVVVGRTGHQVGASKER